ncbi:MAG TPA: hypothetical protein VEZ90_09855 [Blastocatellia bacterium]|nr:hypothetical protein [Blastocatellia bacterium]
MPRLPTKAETCTVFVCLLSHSMDLRVRISIQSRPARAGISLLAFVVFLLMAFAILKGFVTGVLADERVLPRTAALTELAQLVPDDARVQEKLARAEFDSEERDLPSAEQHARRACELSPWNSPYELLLSSIEDAAGDQAAAASALDAAARLAPNDSDVRWRLANLLVRQGKLAEAADEFKSACSSSADLLPLAMDTMWSASGQTVDYVVRSVPDDDDSQLNLAAFLVSKAQVVPAVNVFERVPRRNRIAAPMTKPFIDWLIDHGYAPLARQVWAEVSGLSPGSGVANLPLLINGGFDEKPKHFGEFDWQLSSSKYAQVAMDSTVARSGSKSLKIEFNGVDTTVLDQEVHQLVVLPPGKSYALQWYVKAAVLSTPEGPRITVTDKATGVVIAQSDPIESGSYDWQRGGLEIPVPESSSEGIALLISLKRKPKFSYDEPTRGTIWLDDFSLIPK